MADILIRGLEMPTEHRIEVLIFKNGFVAYYDVEGRYIGQAKAVPLPEGHGRLGDLDRLFEVVGQDADRWIVDEVSMIETDDVLDAIQNAPTIVPAEGGTDECSEK